MIINPITGTSGQPTRSSAPSSGVIAPLIPQEKPILSTPPPSQTSAKTQSQPGLLDQISSVLVQNLNPLVKGGVSAGIERVKKTPLKEYFLPTSSSPAGETFRGYISGTLDQAVKTIKGAGKLTPTYSIFRAATGKPITPKEYVSNLLSTGVDTLGLLWRVNPIAPAFGATLNTLKTLRQKAQGKEITWDDLVNAPIRGINEQPGFGAVFTDNVKTAQAIDIAFMATMIARPFISKKLSSLNLKAEEINQASKALGVSPAASLEEVSTAFKNKIRRLPDTFTLNPSPENMAIRTELTNAFNILKKAGVIDKKYASAYEFLSKSEAKPSESKLAQPEPKRLGTGTEAPVQATPELKAPTSLLVSHEGAPDITTVAEYKAKIQLGERIEPIKVIREGEKYGVEDGKHRLQAYQELGIKNVPIEIVGTKESISGEALTTKGALGGVLEGRVMGETGKTGEVVKAESSTTQAPVVETRNTPESAPKLQEKPNTELKSRVFERLRAEHPELEGDLTYNSITLKNESDKAVDLILSDKQKAYEIAMGKQVSSDITSTSANIALAERALEEGNKELYANLIKNRSLAQTRRGQELVSERASVTDNGTSRYVKELLNARMENVGKTYLSDLKGGKASMKERAVATVDNKVSALEKKISSKKLDVKTAIRLLDELACV